MGLFVVTSDYEHSLEITEDGDLLFGSYDIEYDLAMQEFGEPKTHAVKILDLWNSIPIKMFLRLIDPNYFSKHNAVLIAKTWAKKIAEYTGVKSFYGLGIDSLFVQIENATSVGSDQSLTSISSQIGQAAAGYQQQTWLHSSPSGYSPVMISSALNLALSMVIMDYIRICEVTTYPLSHWQTAGGREVALMHLDNIPSHCTEAIARAELFSDEENFVPYQEVTLRMREIEKRLIGAAVREMIKERG